MITIIISFEDEDGDVQYTMAPQGTFHWSNLEKSQIKGILVYSNDP